MADIARLEIIIDAQKARRDVAALKAELTALGTVTTQVSVQSQASFKNMEGLLNQIRISVNSLNSAYQTQSTRINTIGASASRLPGILAAAFSVDRIFAFGKASLQAAIDFERIQNVLTLVTGSAQEARQQFQFLREQSDRIGIVFRSSATEFSKFEAAARGTGITTKQLKETFVTVAEAGRRFGLTASDQSRIFLALEQMISKGVVSMEELRRQLGDALPGAFQIASRAMGMTGAEFNKLVASGSLMTKDFLGPFTKELAKMAPAGETVASTAAEINRLKNAWDRFLASNGIATPVRFAARAGTSILEAFSPVEERRRELADIQRKMEMDSEADKVLTSQQKRGMDTYDFSSFYQIRAEQEMARREQARSGFAQGFHGLEGSIGGYNIMSLFAGEKDPTAQQTKKYNRLVRDLSDEGLDEKNTIIASYKAQEEAVKEMGLTWRQEADAIQKVNEARDRRLSKFDSDLALKKESEAAKEMTANFLKAQEASERFFIEGIGDPAARKVEEINKKFRESVYVLLQLDEAGQNVTDQMKSLEYSMAYDKARARDRNVRADNYKGPQGFRDVIDKWGDMEDRITEGSGQVAESLDHNFTDAFASIITGTKSASEAFKQMSTSIISDLARIFVEKLITRTIISGFGSIGGAGGGDAGVDHADFGNFNHYGGVVGKRFHRGGLVGDEMPITARRGEVIFTPEQMGALGKVVGANSGGDRQQSVNIVNVMSDDAFDAMLLRRSNTLLNVMGKNRKTIRMMVSA